MPESEDELESGTTRVTPERRRASKRDVVIGGGVSLMLVIQVLSQLGVLPNAQATEEADRRRETRLVEIDRKLDRVSDQIEGFRSVQNSFMLKKDMEIVLLQLARMNREVNLQVPDPPR